MFNSLCEEMIALIFEYTDSLSSYNLSMCNKFIYECTKKRGFVKHLSYNYPKCDYNLFMKRYLRISVDHDTI